MQAVIATGGKQLLVKEGDVVFIEKLAQEEGSEVLFDKVLSILGEKISIGTPYVKKAVVKAEVVKHGLNKKIIVFRYRAKHNVRVKRGHRQPYTLVKITEISNG